MGALLDETALKCEGDIIIHLLSPFAALGLLHKADVAVMAAATDLRVAVSAWRQDNT